jgi:hypothetical protein
MDTVKNDFNHLSNTISLKFVFALFVLSVFTITTLPGTFLLTQYIYYIQFVVFIFFILLTFTEANHSNGKPTKFNFFHALLFVSFVLFLISSFYVNFEINFELKSIFKLISYPIVIYLFMFYLPKHFYLNDQLFDKFLNGFLYFSIFAAIVALSFFFLNVNINQKYSYTSIGFFAHPNSTAFIYTFSIPILIYKYYHKSISKGFLIVCAVILGLGFIFTLSRGGYLGVFTAMSILLFSYSKRMFFLTLICLVPLILYIIFNVASSKGDSSYPRLLLAITAYDMIFNRGMTNMLWGYGIFNNIEVFVKDKYLFGSIEDVVDPHNVFLLLSIQFGILLTISVTILVLFLLIRIAFKSKKFWSMEKKLRVQLCLSIICGLIAQNLLEDIVVYPEYYVMAFFLILFGYLYLAVYEKDEKIT